MTDFVILAELKSPMQLYLIEIPIDYIEHPVDWTFKSKEVLVPEASSLHAVSTLHINTMSMDKRVLEFILYKECIVKVPDTARLVG